MRVAVRSEALVAAAVAVQAVADGLRADAGVVAGSAVAMGRSVGGALLPWEDGGRWLRAAAVRAACARLEARLLALAGPSGLWGQALLLDAVVLHLRAAARAYVEVEQVVTAVMAGVARGADRAGIVGWFVDGSAPPTLRVVEPTLRGPVVGRRLAGVAQLVAAGEGLGGGRVRVLETLAPGGRSAWVVVVPGTQEWSPRAGTNPFDLTGDVRAVTGDATVAAAGVAAALDLARAKSARSRPDDPVLLVGHSQGGILAAALAADQGFTHRNRVTHLVTSGAPVALFPVPGSVRVLSVEHADDPVPRLDLSPAPSGSSWVSVRAPVVGLPVDLRRHALDAYVRTVRTVEDAPRGTVPGLDGWLATSGAFVGAPVLAVTEVVVERRWQDHAS